MAALGSQLQDSPRVLSYAIRSWFNGHTFSPFAVVGMDNQRQACRWLPLGPFSPSNQVVHLLAGPMLSRMTIVTTILQAGHVIAGHCIPMFAPHA